MELELSQQESGLHPTKGPNLEKHISVLYYMKEGKQGRAERAQNQKFSKESLKGGIIGRI
jgi:hypothetical protein